MPIAVGLIASTVLIAGFGLWSLRSQIAGAVIATGQIEVASNKQILQHPDGGVVAAVNFEVGDTVATGDVLIVLEGGQLQLDYEVTNARLFEVRVRRVRLEAERDDLPDLDFSADLMEQAQSNAEFEEALRGQVALFEARKEAHEQEKEHLRGRITQIEAQVQGLLAQEIAFADQLALAREQLSRQEQLQGQGLARSDPITQLKRDIAQLNGSIGALIAQNAETTERVVETELEIIQLGSTRREQAITELRELRVLEEELRQRSLDLQRRIEALSISAPVAGRILELSVIGPKSVVQPAEPIASLVPSSQDFIVTVRVPTIHIDQVYPGQNVLLQFPAFDQRNMPDLFGSVVQVSADTLIDEQSRQSFYEAEVSLTFDEQLKLGERTLLPGMPVNAFIQTSLRTPMDYFIEPISIFLERALREP